MRKLVAILIALLLMGILVALTGCSGNTDQTGWKPQPETSCVQMFIA